MLLRAPKRVAFDKPIDLSQSALDAQQKEGLQALATVVGAASPKAGADEGIASPTSAISGAVSGAGAMPTPPSQQMELISKLLLSPACDDHPEDRLRCYETTAGGGCRALRELGHNDVWAWMAHTVHREVVSSDDTIANRK